MLVVFKLTVNVFKIMQAAVDVDGVDKESPDGNVESFLPESLVPEVNVYNEVSNVEAGPTNVGGFEEDFTEGVELNNDGSNNDIENVMDDDIGENPGVDDGTAVFVDDLSPNTINQLEVVMKRFDVSPGGSKVVEDVVIGESMKKVGESAGGVSRNEQATDD